MSLAKEGTKKPMRKRHIGLAGALIAAMQFWIGAKNEATTQKAFEQVIQSQMKATTAELREERERDFVRKSDLNATLRRLDRKLDQVDQKLDVQNTKISKIEGYLKARKLFGVLLEDPQQVSQR